MPYEPLHHKYRPQTFAELVGQEAIATTLTYALRQQKIAPAYLFTGARGTGKTSSARILAKSLNCLQSTVPTEKPCGHCEVCRSIANGSALDVIEIDAASNTGVDNIRELIERAQFAPVQCRYKVYVIDECHMLSSASFNALLKTLEEPPDRVVFVLATTDPQRVLPTIISRCQRFDFRRIELDAMVQHLRSIAAKESISISLEALNLVAQISQGGLRDAESLLDQLSLLEGEITPDRVWDLVGAVPERDLLALVQAIAADEGVTVLDHARHLLDRGREPLVVLQNLTSFYRDMLIAKTSPARSDLVAITPPTWAELCAFVQSFDLSWILFGQQHLRACEPQVKNTTQPRLWLEVTLLGLLPSASNLGGNLGGNPAGNPAGSATGTAPQISAPPPRSIAPPPVPAAQPQIPPAIKTPPVPAVSPQPIAAAPPAQEPVAVQAETNGNGHAASEPNNGTSKAEPPQVPPQVPPVPAIEPQQDWSELWEQILNLVQPFSTRTMLRQQCLLIHFSGQEARIGARSQNLFKMAKDRLPNIEVAFTKLYSRPIKVTLEVALRNDGAVSTPSLPSAQNPPKNPAFQNPPSNHPSSNHPLYPPVPPEVPPQVKEVSPSGFGTDNLSVPSLSRQESEPDLEVPAAAVGSSTGDSTGSSTGDSTGSSTGSSTGDSTGSSGTIAPGAAAKLGDDRAAAEPLDAAMFAPAPEVWQVEDEVTRAAKSLAQMFNGQIVNWDAADDDAIVSSSETLLSLAPSSLEALDSDPDGDVPF